MLALETVSLSNSRIVAAAETLLYEDCTLNDLSDPAGWADVLNLYVPIPAVVVPIPTILDLTETGLVVISFSNFND